MSDRWTTPEKDPRTYGNPVGELETYREYLTNHRLTIELKCEGLGPDDLARRSVPPSTLSLLGLIRHLAPCRPATRVHRRPHRTVAANRRRGRYAAQSGPVHGSSSVRG